MEVAELLRNGATNGSLNAAINTGGEMIREALPLLEAFSPNEHVQALRELGDALIELLEQLRM